MDTSDSIAWETTVSDTCAVLATDDGLSTDVEVEVTAFCTACWTAADMVADRASKLRLIIPLFRVEVLSGGTSASGGGPAGRVAVRVEGRAAHGLLTGGMACTKQIGLKINV